MAASDLRRRRRSLSTHKRPCRVGSTWSLERPRPPRPTTALISATPGHRPSSDWPASASLGFFWLQHHLSPPQFAHKTQRESFARTLLCWARAEAVFKCSLPPRRERLLSLRGRCLLFRPWSLFLSLQARLLSAETSATWLSDASPDALPPSQHDCAALLLPPPPALLPRAVPGRWPRCAQTPSHLQRCASCGPSHTSRRHGTRRKKRQMPTHIWTAAQFQVHVTSST